MEYIGRSVEMIPKLDEYKDRWHITSDPAIKPGLDAMHIALELVGNPPFIYYQIVIQQQTSK